jgi:two-component system OmpR family response regulator
MGERDKYPGTVVIIEDDRNIRKLLATSFTKKHFNVLLAARGREGIELIEKHASEITHVVVDLNLTDIGGLEVIRKTRPLLSSMHLIITSGVNGGPLDELLSDMKATYVEKPYDVEELVDSMQPPSRS